MMTALTSTSVTVLCSLLAAGVLLAVCLPSRHVPGRGRGGTAALVLALLLVAITGAARGHYFPAGFATRHLDSLSPRLSPPVFADADLALAVNAHQAALHRSYRPWQAIAAGPQADALLLRRLRRPACLVTRLSRLTFAPALVRSGSWGGWKIDGAYSEPRFPEVVSLCRAGNTG